MDRSFLRRSSTHILRRLGALTCCPWPRPWYFLASRLRPKWLAAGFALQLALGLALAVVNYQHWDGYRQFAHSLRLAAAGHRVWIDGEWGLRYYLESDGALPLKKTQRLRPATSWFQVSLAPPSTPPPRSLRSARWRSDPPSRCASSASNRTRGTPR